MKIFLLLTAILFSTILPAQVKVKASPGDGVTLVNHDTTFKITVGFRFQTLVEARSASNDPGKMEYRMQVRRSRLNADGFAFSPKLVYKVELGSSNSDIGPALPETNHAPLVILDAVAKYSLSENISLWFGQTKLPGNRERVISSQQLQFVDRSIVNSDFNIDRDLGLQLHAKQNAGKMVFREAIAITQGEGRNIVEWNEGLAYTGRFEWLPMGAFNEKGDYIGSSIYREEKPKLSFGLTYSYNDEAWRTGGQLGSFLDKPRDLQTTFADLMFKLKGFSVMSELAVRNHERTNNVMEFQGYGFTVQSGYLLKSGYELAARYSMNDFTPSSAIDDETMYTLGFSKFFSGHDLKIQSDVSYLLTGNNPVAGLLYRVQLEIAL